MDLVPLLFVSNLEGSIAFYREKLAFEVTQKAVNQSGSVFWCRISRDGCSLMLEQEDPEEDGPLDHRGQGVHFYFICEDADKKYAEMVANGLNLPAPRNAYYGMRQVELTDPDGYRLCFESPLPKSPE